MSQSNLKAQLKALIAAKEYRADYVAVRYGRDAIYVSYSGHSYDNFGHNMSDQITPLDCSKCGKR